MREGSALPAVRPDHVLALLLAAALAARLVGVLGVVTVRTLLARRRHRDLLDLLGTPWPAVPGARVLDHPVPVAYCLPGLRSRLVVSAGVLDTLDPHAVRAVLAHEQAHLRERHDLVVLPFVAWGATAPFVRGMVCAQVAVAALIEMRADDVAAARTCAAELTGALRSMGGAAPAAALSSFTAALDHRLDRITDAARAAAAAGPAAGPAARGGAWSGCPPRCCCFPECLQAAGSGRATRSGPPSSSQASPTSGSTTSSANAAGMPISAASPPTSAAPTLAPVRNTRVAIPSATPRSRCGTAEPTEEIIAGCPTPNATPTSTTAAASSTGDCAAAPNAATASATTAVGQASAIERRAPSRASRVRASGGDTNPITAAGTSSRPVASGVQPQDAAASGTPSSSANQLAGTAAAANALRSTVVLVTISRGRKPCGCRRTRRASSGAPATSSAAPTPRPAARSTATGAAAPVPARSARPATPRPSPSAPRFRRPARP